MSNSAMAMILALEMPDRTLVNRKGEVVSYRQPPEFMGVPGRDSDRSSFGTPDLSRHAVKKVIEGLTTDEAILIEALREIDPISRIAVYSTAVTQLNEARREKQNLKDKRKKEILEKAVKILGKAIAES